MSISIVPVCTPIVSKKNYQSDKWDIKYFIACITRTATSI